MSNYLRKRNDLGWFGDSIFRDLFDYSDNKNMSTDIKETENEYQFLVDLPGLNKDNIKLSLENGYLTIQAHVQKNEENTSTDKYIRRERYYGTMSRSYYIGENIEESDIKASFKDGVLMVVVPKEAFNKVEEKKFIAID